MLTEDEMELVDHLGKAMGMFNAICGKGITRMADLEEVCDKIHQLQNIVLSQSAAREYPDRYRLMGGTVNQ